MSGTLSVAMKREIVAYTLSEVSKGVIEDGCCPKFTAAFDREEVTMDDADDFLESCKAVLLAHIDSER